MPSMSLLRAVRPMSVGTLSPKDKSFLQNILRNFGTSGAKSGGGGHKTIPIQPSRFQWNKYKDHLHFYIMLGVIPLSLITFYANVFIGPSTLAEIPEGYEPKQYEYYKNPVTRFIAKHFQDKFQKTYEMNIHFLVEEDEKRRMRLLTRRVDELMRQRGDYPNYYTNRHILSKYVRGTHIAREEIELEAGEE